MDTCHTTVALLALLLAGGCVAAPSRPSSINGRVVNGSDALPGEFPYMASLRGSTGLHTCGATIIHEEWVMTAAHCLYSLNPETYSVQYGSNEITLDGDYLVDVTELIVHQGYDDNSFVHDIALVKLAKPIVFDDLVQPVRLPEYMEFAPGGVQAELMGWGLNESTGVLQSWLQKVHLKTMTDDKCRTYHFDKVFPTNICAGVDEGGKGQCKGDSGGPLIVDGQQVGIVSWSMKPCTMTGYPGVYTEVTYYIGWLREHTGISELGRSLH